MKSGGGKDVLSYYPVPFLPSGSWGGFAVRETNLKIVLLGEDFMQARKTHWLVSSDNLSQGADFPQSCSL